MVVTINTAMMISWSWSFIGPTSIIPPGKPAAGRRGLLLGGEAREITVEDDPEGDRGDERPEHPGLHDRSWNAI